MWWVIAGCFHAGLHVPGGDLVPPGTLGLRADGTPLTVAPAAVDLGGDTVRATFGARSMVHPMMALFLPPYAVGGGLRLGVARGLEATVDLGAQEVAGGLRVALAPRVALSASGGIYPSWFPAAPNPRGTLTVDASVGRARASLGGSVGEQVYAGFVPARLLTPCGSFGEPGCGEYAPPPAILASRTEVRLLGALGVEVPVDGDDDEVAGVTLAVVPWLTLATLGPDTLSAGRVAGPGPSDFRATGGASAVVALAWGPWSTRSEGRWWLDEDQLRGPPSGEGPWTEVFDDGGTDEGPWRRGRRHGAFVSRWPDGTTRWARGYRRGALHGWSERYGADGTLLEVGAYRHGRQRGPWRGWYPDGSPRYDGVFRPDGQGRWVSWAEDGTETLRRP